MAKLTIDHVDEKMKERLRLRAARHGRSLEEEARQILSRDLNGEAVVHPQNLADAVAALVDPVGGIELDLPMRILQRAPPWFGGDEEDDEVR